MVKRGRKAGQPNGLVGLVIPVRDNDAAEFARIAAGGESSYTDPDFPVLDESVTCLDPLARLFCKWQMPDGALCDAPSPAADGWCVEHRNRWGGGASNRPRLM